MNFLLQNGASVNTLSRDGCNALHEAAFFGNTELMRLLVEAGSDIEVYAEASFRPMDVALAMGHEAAVQLLVEKDASLKADSHHVSIIKDDLMMIRIAMTDCYRWKPVYFAGIEPLYLDVYVIRYSKKLDETKIGEEKIQMNGL